jgi:hypothetical protein
MLLIEYLEKASLRIGELTEKLRRLDKQYRQFYDRDIRREMTLIKKEIKRIRSDAMNELLFSLEQFHYLRKYFPELLETFMEDEYIGSVLRKKAWLLDFKQLPSKESAMRLEQLRMWRLQLKDAKNTLTGWVGKVSARAFVATYPTLRGHMRKDLEKDEAIELVDKVDKMLRKQGWLLLISDSLIKIPVAKFMDRIQRLRNQELMARGELNRAKGKGSVAETAAIRKVERLQKKRVHYEKVLTQILLSNPKALRSMKKKKSWLSRERKSSFERFLEGIVPHKVKERAWLNEMKKRIEQEK